jgi:hypothetical protein
MATRIAIAIPTYNRPHSIQKRIDELIRLRDYDLQVWIADNSTNDLTREVVTLSHGIRIIYTKNRFSIGGGANFLKSLMIGTADYVWLRGDDDPITEEQLDAVSKAIDNSPDIIIISRNASSSVRIYSIHDFFDNFQVSQAAGWLSMLVFKQESLGNGMKWGYWGIKSGWANVALLLGILHECPSAFCMVVPAVISPSDFREGGRQARQWSIIKTCVDSFPSLFTITNDSRLRRHAFYCWRKTQSFNLVRTFARSRLGLAPQETISWKTFANLLSFRNPRSSLVAISLLLLQLTPRFILSLAFSSFSPFLTTKYLRTLELDCFDGLSVPKRFMLLRQIQSRLGKLRSLNFH